MCTSVEDAWNFNNNGGQQSGRFDFTFKDIIKLCTINTFVKQYFDSLFVREMNCIEINVQTTRIKA